MRESYWRDGGESGHQGRGELRRTPMTLRSEMYCCVLKSSLRSGRGVLATRRALSISRAMLKDPGRGQPTGISEGAKKMRWGCARRRTSEACNRLGLLFLRLFVHGELMMMKKKKNWSELDDGTATARPRSVRFRSWLRLRLRT
jgi:hypothetical protein